MYVLTGLGITVGFHRMLTHRSFKTTPFVKGVFTALGSAAIEGPGDLLGRRPPQAPRVLRPPGRSAQPARRPRLGLARRAQGASCTRTSAGCSCTRTAAAAARYAPDLIKDPVVSAIDRRFVLCVAGGLVAPVPARLRLRRHAARRLHRHALGRRRARARPASLDVLDQLALPLLRPPPLRHEGRVAQPALARAVHVRRGVAQQPPRVPDVRRARHAPLGARPVGVGDLGAREDRAWPGTSCASRATSRPRSTRRRLEHAAAARRAGRGAARAPVPRRASGTARELPATTNGDVPVFSVRSPRRARPHAARARASSGSAAPT